MALNHIFPIGTPWCRKEDELELHVDNSESLIFIGGKESISLSLLFQLAVSYASKELSVTFICQKPLSTLPRCVHGMPQPDAKTLSTLKFLYLSTVDELMEYCSSIHLKTVLPDVLIVADFHLYLGHGQTVSEEHTAAKLLALLLDTIKFIKKKSQFTDCKLIISCSDSIKWIKSVATKYNFQVLKITENEDLTGRVEWDSLDKQNLLTFKIEKDELFMDKLHIQKVVESQ